MGFRQFTLIALITLVACGPTEPDHSEFAIGMSRPEIREKFGQPQQTQTLTKTTEPVWGPIEAYWSQVPMGATVEIWSYDSRMITNGNGSALKQRGQTELYFVNNSNEVNGIGFHLEGAIY